MAIDWSSLAYPKVKQTRRDDKLEKRATERAAEKKARDIAWKRCGGRCENAKCAKRISRGGGLINGAHYHHDPPKSLDPKNHKGRWLCGQCHFSGPSGAHRGRG